MIPALGAGGPGFNSQLTPFFFFTPPAKLIPGGIFLYESKRFNILIDNLHNVPHVPYHQRTRIQNTYLSKLIFMPGN